MWSNDNKVAVTTFNVQLNNHNNYVGVAMTMVAVTTTGCYFRTSVGTTQKLLPEQQINLFQ